MSGCDRLLFLDSRSVSLNTPVLLNQNPPKNDKFLVRKIICKITANVTAAGGGNCTPTFDNFGKDSTIEAFWQQTGDVWLNNVSLAGLDIWAQRQHSPLDAYQGYAISGQSVTAGQSEDLEYYFEIPLYRPNAYNGSDYVCSLREIGQFTVKIAGIDDATNFSAYNSGTVELFAVGQNAQEGQGYVAGTLTRLDFVSGETGNDVYLQSYGHKVRDLWEQSSTAASIATEVGARVELDGREVVFGRGLGVNELGLFWSDSGGGAKVAESAADQRTQTRVGSLLPPQHDKKLSQMSNAQTIHISYSSRTSASVMRFALETVYPAGSGSKLLNRIPNGGNMSTVEIVESIKRPSNTAGVSAALAQYLPAIKSDN